jgi:hypothetical protein
LLNKEFKSYKGAWKNNLKDGLGLMELKDNNISIEGIWNADEMPKTGKIRF